MRIKVATQDNPRGKTVEGAEAKVVIRDVLGKVGRSILIPEPPYTGIARRRAIQTLRNGAQIYVGQRDHNGQPKGKGMAVSLLPKIVGIIHEDGTYEETGDTTKKE